MKGKKSAVVVGGGISGLTSAYELAKLGYNATILEKNSQLGGRLYPFANEGFRVDAGAQYITENYVHTLQLIKELGLINELIEIKEPSTALYTDGAFFSISPVGMFRYSKFKLPDRLKLIKLLKGINRIGKHEKLSFTNLKREDYFDSTSIADWIVEEYSERLLEYFVQPSLTAATLTDPEKLSKFYGISLMYSDLKRAFIIKNGLSSLTSTLYRRLNEFGVDIKTNCEVKRIDIGGDEKEVIYKCNDAEDIIQSSNVICSTPAPITIELLPSLPVESQLSLSKVEYSNALQVIFALDEKIWTKTWAIIIPREELDGIAVICEPTLKCESFAPRGRGLMEVYIYGSVASKLSKLSTSEIMDFILERLETIFPKISKKVTWCEVLRWDRVIPIHSPGFSDLRKGFELSTKGLVLAGDYLYLPSIEAAVFSGIEACRQIIHSNKSKLVGK